MYTIAQCVEMLEKAYNDVTFKNAILNALDTLNYRHTIFVNASYDPVVYEKNVDISVRGIEYEITLKNGLPREKEESNVSD